MPSDQVPWDHSTSQNIRLHEPSRHTRNRSNIPCGQYEGIVWAKTIEFQLHFIKALQHTSLKPQEVEVEVTLLPTVSRPVHPGVRHTSGTRDQFFFVLEIFFRQLRVCYFLAPSLTRGRVCNLLLLLVLASGIPLDFESRGTQDHIYLGGQVPVFMSPRNRVAQLYPWALGSLLSPLTTRRATVEVFWPGSTRRGEPQENTQESI
jgi:hypothetical protein